MQVSKALAELLGLQGNVDEARVVFKEARDRLAAAASRGPAAGPRWIGPGRRAKGSARDREEETEGMAELLLAWANVEESVSLGCGVVGTWAQFWSYLRLLACLFLVAHARRQNQAIYIHAVMFARPSVSCLFSLVPCFSTGAPADRGRGDSKEARVCHAQRGDDCAELCLGSTG